MKKKILFAASAVSLLLLVGFGYYHYSKPTISVIMSTYNRGNLLSRAVKSILSQTYKDFELIIVDDGSKDHTEKVLLGFKNRDSRVKLLKNETNKGLIYSRNKALKAARGKYIAIMDSDDQAFPNRLEKSLKVFEENSDVMAVSAATYDIENPFDASMFEGWDDYHIIDNDFAVSLMFKNTFPNPAAMFRSDFVKKHKITYNSEYESAEDYDFWKQFVLNGGKIVTILEPLTFIRRHSTNKPEYYEKMAATSKKIHGELIGRFFEPSEKEVLDSYDLGQHCFLVDKIAKINKEKQIIDHESLLHYQKKNCPNDMNKAYYVKYLTWSDFIVPKDDDYVLFSTGEKVSLEKDGEILLIQLKDQPKHRFKKHSDENVYLLYEYKTLSLKHRGWEDDLYAVDEKEKRYCRFSNQDCGIITKKPKGVIEVKWDQPAYDKEVFVFDEGLNKYIQK